MSELIGDKFIFNGLEKSVTEWQELDSATSVIYDVVRIEEGIPIFLNDYLDRLENSFQLINFKCRYSRIDIIRTIKDLIRINKFESGPIKLIFGFGRPEFFIAYLMQPHLPNQEEYKNGVKTILLNTVRLNPNAKVWNQNLRKQTIDLLSENQAYEAILVNSDGYITEGSRSNIFFIQGDTVITTPEDQVLQGITRKKILEVCDQEGIKMEMKNILHKQINEYKVSFLTGTSRQIVPVKSIGKIEFETKNKLLQQISIGFENLVSKYLKDNQRIT